ncbi:MAG: ABC transporter, partial [Treponema sp.]|nr:ABC transporter [Treponema sp.]
HDDDIIGIRSRTVGSGRLDRITDPAMRAAAMRFSRTVNLFVVPILVIVAGIFFSFRRKAAARADVE